MPLNPDVIRLSVAESVRSGQTLMPMLSLMINLSPIEKLIAQWRKEADQYQRQVDEARSKNLPHDQMLAAATFLRQCAKALEAELSFYQRQLILKEKALPKPISQVVTSDWPNLT